MGKKTKTKEISPVKRHELTQLVSLLLRSTRDDIQPKISSDWTQFLEITKNLDQLRRLQAPLKNDGPSRDNALGAFNEWCLAGGAQFNEVEVKKISASYEMGLVAKADLPADKIFIKIPDNLIFSWRRVEIKLPMALRACPLFDASHVRLAFALCVERLSPSTDSEWRPYLDILPPAYRTCLYWTPAEMEELKGSTTTLPAALKQCKFIAAQYAFLYKCVQTLQGPEPILQALKDNFTYELYRWAVSTVMTRQNVMPIDADGVPESVLIPLWDMANHVNGHVTTEYVAPYIESRCVKDFKKNEQILISYAQRNNSDFLIHNGFVYPENDSYDYSIKLSVSQSDPLYEERSKLLALLELKPSDLFKVAPVLTKEVLAFVRVFQMNKDQLVFWLSESSVQALFNDENPPNASTEQKVLEFLETRFEIFLKAFPTTIAEDRELLEQKFSSTKLMLVQYRILEKQTLEKVLETIGAKMNKVKTE